MNHKDFNKFVDEYYNSRESNENLEIPKDNDISFLYSSLEKMDIIKDDSFDLNIDLMNVISQGEEIVQKKKDRLEFILFVLCVTLIVAFVSVCIFLNKDLIYVVLAVAVIIPFALIPLSYVKAVRGNIHA